MFSRMVIRRRETLGVQVPVQLGLCLRLTACQSASFLNVLVREVGHNPPIHRPLYGIREM